MSETKFTPGPWHIGNGRNTGARTIIAVDETWVGFAYGTRLGVGTVEAVEANAKLIAAAPDMYAELQDTHEHLLMLYSAINGRSMDFETILQELRDRMTKQRKLIDKATN